MSARSKRSRVYGDFLGDFRKEPKIYCDMCRRWIPPSFFKKGRPQYLHTCSDYREIEKQEELNDAKKENP